MRGETEMSLGYMGWELGQEAVRGTLRNGLWMDTLMVTAGGRSAAKSRATVFDGVTPFDGRCGMMARIR